MRVIIAGSRNASERDVRKAADSCPWIGFVTAVVSGTARGADEYGERWAEDNGIPINRFPADWEKYGKRAGPVRNQVMAENAEALLAVWDGASRGTASMISLAEKRGLRIGILRTDLGRFEEVSAQHELANWWDFLEERAAIMEFCGGWVRREAERQAVKDACSSFPMLAILLGFSASR